MSAGLNDLLRMIREHPALPELLALIDSAAAIKPYHSPREAALDQAAEWIFRSGRQLQANAVKELLTQYQSLEEEKHERRKHQPATRG